MTRMPNQTKDQTAPVALLCGENADKEFTLKMRLARDGYLVIPVSQLEILPMLCKRHRPVIVLLQCLRGPSDVIGMLRRLSGVGMPFRTYGTFLLVRKGVARLVAPLLEIGLEDILDIESGMEPLAQRLRDYRQRLIGASALRTSASVASTTQGNLGDLSLIDLIQALGPSQRTTRLTVTSSDLQAAPLVLYLLKGVITHVALGDRCGESAIYEALGWHAGTWLMEPLEEAQIPEPNNTLPNDFLLMEGCRRLDERRAESTASDQTAERSNSADSTLSPA